MGTVVVVNPAAGRGRGERILEALRRHRPVVTGRGNLRDRLAGRVEAEDLVGVVGGDGTVSAVVDALFRSGLGKRVRLAILPVGIGNDIARSVGVGPGPADSRRWLRESEAAAGPWRRLSVWRLGARHFVAYVSVGLDARVLRTADRWRGIGPTSPVLRRAALAAGYARWCAYRIEGNLALELEADPGGVGPAARRREGLSGRAGAVLTNLGLYLGGRRMGAASPSARSLSLTTFDSAVDLARVTLCGAVRRGPVLPYRDVGGVRIRGGPAVMQMDGEVASFRHGRIRFAGRFTVLGGEDEAP